MSKAISFCKCINYINEVVGKIVSILVLPLTLIVTYEVIMRYVFNAPTVWSWDVNMYLGGLMAILGGGYAHSHGCHVSVEILLENWKPQNRMLLGLILSPLILLPCVLLVWLGSEAAWHSVKIGERVSSLWEPPIYPLKIAIPIGGALFLLQGISNFLSDLIRYHELREKRGA